MVLAECPPAIIFLQSEDEARRFRDKVKFDCFKPACIKTPIEDIDILDSEEDGNSDPRSVAGYVKRREGRQRRAIEPPSRSNNKRGNYTDRGVEKEADGLGAGSGSGNGGEDGEGGSGGGGEMERRKMERRKMKKREMKEIFWLMPSGWLLAIFRSKIQPDLAPNLDCS
jgi:hypothetical protein